MHPAYLPRLSDPLLLWLLWLLPGLSHRSDQLSLLHPLDLLHQLLLERRLVRLVRLVLWPLLRPLVRRGPLPRQRPSVLWVLGLR